MKQSVGKYRIGIDISGSSRAALNIAIGSLDCAFFNVNTSARGCLIIPDNTIHQNRTAGTSNKYCTTVFRSFIANYGVIDELNFYIQSDIKSSSSSCHRISADNIIYHIRTTVIKANPSSPASSVCDCI